MPYRWLLLVLVGMTSFTGCFFLEMECENTINQEIASPSGNWKLVRFGRDCGATTSGSTQVSILKKGQELPDYGGNIFIAEPCRLEMKWISEHEVLIKYQVPAEVISKLTEFEGITIRYDTFHLPQPVFDSTKRVGLDTAVVERIHIKHGEWNDPHWKYVNGVTELMITDSTVIKDVLDIMEKSKIVRYPGLHVDWLHVGLHYQNSYVSAAFSRTADGEIYFEIRGDWYNGKAVMEYLQKHTRP